MTTFFLNNIGNLSDIQHSSFFRFLYKGLSEELNKFPNPFYGNLKINNNKNRNKKDLFTFYIIKNNIKFQGPNICYEDCLKYYLTYSIFIYVSIQYSYIDNKKEKDKKLTYNNYKKIVKKDLLFGEIPCITEDGTFLINGCERIVISQIIRSPGVYFQKKIINNKFEYFATIISNNGMWTKILFKNPENFNENNDVFSIKLPSQIEADVSLIQILKICYGLDFFEILDNIKYTSLLSKSLENEYFRIISTNDEEKLINNVLYSDIFSIGTIGRYKLNKKLNLKIPQNITYITFFDLIKIIDELVELKYKNKASDDIDHINNKQIRSIGELLQKIINITFFKILKTKKYTENVPFINKETEIIKNYKNIFVNPYIITNSIKDFFITSPLSQYMDQTNPLAEQTHKRKISVFGQNGMKRDSITNAVRDIHPSFYGRICPIDTPEGQNAGLIHSLAIYGRVSMYGWIDTPYFFVNNGILFKNKTPKYLNPEQELCFNLALPEFSYTKEGVIKKKLVLVKDNNFISLKKKKEIKFASIIPYQFLSLATNLVPFIEHDDGNRALMGSNMQRQAVPLIKAQPALVGTGLEHTCIVDSQTVIKAYNSGIVTYVSSKLISILDLKNQKINYILKNYSASNQETCLNQKPIIWPNEYVFSGQIIADGSSTKDGELALGKNLNVAYMPWEGYNFEDAIVISEKVLTEHLLTSIHINTIKFIINVSNDEEITNNIPNISSLKLSHLDSFGIVSIGSYINENDILIGKISKNINNQDQETNDLKFVLQGSLENSTSIHDSSIYADSHTHGRVIDVKSFFKYENEFEKKISTYNIFISIAELKKITIGDKLAGRHGNKGVVSNILSIQDMPYLPNGEPIDILLNPLGVPSRMNVGQVFEALLGLAQEYIGKRIKVSSFDEIYGKEASRILINQKLKEVYKKTKISWIYNPSFVGKVMLKDGRTGEYFDNPITIGRAYIIKLIHIVSKKIHARSIGPYSLITEQPVTGRSQGGGQRFGEMEVWALEAYGCSYLLQELLTIKSDDIDGKKEKYMDIITLQNIPKTINPSVPEGFLVVIRELNALGFDIILKKINYNFNYKKELQIVEKNIFKDLENKLKIREFLKKKKENLYFL